jgi:hypothetical protein
MYTRVISSDITKTIEVDRVDLMPTECPLVKNLGIKTLREEVECFLDFMKSQIKAVDDLPINHNLKFIGIKEMIDNYNKSGLSDIKVSLDDPNDNSSQLETSPNELDNGDKDE